MFRGKRNDKSAPSRAAARAVDPEALNRMFDQYVSKCAQRFGVRLFIVAIGEPIFGAAFVCVCVFVFCSGG